MKKMQVNSRLKTTLVTALGLFAFVLLPNFAAAQSGDYVYKQKFMPLETVKLDLSTTALFVTDPQNDFLSTESPAATTLARVRPSF